MLGEDGSGVVQTAWALLGLLAAGYEDKSVIDRGIHFLMSKQVSHFFDFLRLRHGSN